ncbi:glycerol kinase GlpK [Alkalilimnicola ehrlichii MLHE-1]|uniref:Glycerol kinase n=1 Tax=Alkalilimnicola ehrlichii (strain ATCC BAA-1101 / DSM 17681 / MLHE-1) TaxID=187272 RepID=GLPK_ALKEH|nr:glycerol kinase GlpK [Alkalilimnicola ehrlichii]Q0A923.1 RecName: Full=Glycerol kinase; AltName: Full=ATP:glycerol 3-phosphotransferase; AltName: Full=Glycerokinase; Short=GK [Alkalilimnicola ehrlichii MLHE-1]ABI56664.1 glycerol kinase [Alkalilimnicola ehrlichii MLHE-1]
MQAILALDQGTTSSRAIVYDAHGGVLGTAQQDFPQYFPQPGWVEHDPGEIWQSQYRVMIQAVERAGIPWSAIAGLGLTNQRETTLLWDRATGEPLHRAIVWQDRRTARLCDDLRRDGHERLFRERTGLLLDPYFSGTKLRWLLDHVPGARRRAEAGELAFGTVDSWLIWQLTGGRLHLTDASNASRTLLCNIHSGDWDPDLLAALDIPAALLPEIIDSSGVCGTTCCAGVPEGIPIAGVAGDQQAALYGQGCHEAGLAKCTYGTGAFLLMHTGERPIASANRLLTTVAWRIGGRTAYALEGSVFIAGAVVQWLRDGLGLIRSSDEIEALARQVPDTGGVYLVPAFAGLGAPHWDPDARGILVGMTRGTERPHIARAALESMAFQATEVIGAMEVDAGLAVKELRVDGGASANDLLMQFQADLLGAPVLRPADTEATAAGAAALAARAVGLNGARPSAEAAFTAFSPRLSRYEVEQRMATWQRAVRRAGGWARDDD